MNVSLTPGLEKFIKDEVASDEYQTSSEVVRDALRLLKQEKDRRKQVLREQIKIGLDELDRGEYIEIKNEQDQKALLARITKGGRARLAAKRKG